jgi:hypothetical protein
VNNFRAYAAVMLLTWHHVCMLHRSIIHLVSAGERGSQGRAAAGDKNNK